MKKTVYTLCLMLLAAIGYAQTDSTTLRGPHVVEGEILLLTRPSKNSVYAELLGNGFAYSLNYERLIYTDNRVGLSTRIGIAPGFVNAFKGFGLPLELNATFLRHKGHMAEMGPGFTWFYGKSRYRNENRELVNTNYYNVCDVTLRIGYKYSQPGGVLLIRAAFIPVFAVVSPAEVRSNDYFPFGKTFTPWAGISVGYAFRK